MITIGRLCVKTAGRDAGKKCVVIDEFNKTYVLIDGETRRRKCNIAHLEPLSQVFDIKKGADHRSVAEIFKTLGISLVDKKPRQPTKRPAQIRTADRKKSGQKPATQPVKKKSAPVQPSQPALKKETKLEKALQ